MAMTPWELILNGSLIQAGYQTYNQAFSFGGQSGYPIGILFIVFLFLMYIQNRSISFNFMLGLIGFGVIFLYIPLLMRGMIASILILELGGILFNWFAKD